MFQLNLKSSYEAIDLLTVVKKGWEHAEHNDDCHGCQLKEA